MDRKPLRQIFALIAVLSLVLLATPSRAHSQEQKVRDRVVNDAFGFAVTIPPGRTATRVQHIGSDAKTLFISVSLPKPVNIDLYAERDPEHDEELKAKIQDYIDLLRKLGGAEITCSGPQPVSLGNLPGSRYRIHLVTPDGKPNDIIWIGGKRTPKPDNDRVIVVSLTLGGSSSDVAEYESELDEMVRSLEWFDPPAPPPNNGMHPTADTSLVIFGYRAGRRVMPGVMRRYLKEERCSEERGSRGTYRGPCGFRRKLDAA